MQSGLMGKKKVAILLAENFIKLNQPATPEAETEAPADKAEETAEEKTEQAIAEGEPSTDSNDET